MELITAIAEWITSLPTWLWVTVVMLLALHAFCSAYSALVGPPDNGSGTMAKVAWLVRETIERFGMNVLHARTFQKPAPPKPARKK